MKSGFQTTLNDRVSLEGIGVHSGKPVSLTLHPTEADTGIVFLRTNLDGGR
jgi:UDP-3-O-[3-hydroxymyristoyl] N-acetylglucosamine deacetylase